MFGDFPQNLIQRADPQTLVVRNHDSVGVTVDSSQGSRDCQLGELLYSPIFDKAPPQPPTHLNLVAASPGIPSIGSVKRSVKQRRMFSPTVAHTPSGLIRAATVMERDCFVAQAFSPCSSDSKRRECVKQADQAAHRLRVAPSSQTQLPTLPVDDLTPSPEVPLPCAHSVNYGPARR